MNNWTNNGNCTQGKCICNQGFYGADCSITSSPLAEKQLTLNATSWEYFNLANKNDRKIISVSSDKEFYVYTRKGNVPSQTFYEWYLQGNRLEFLMSSDNSGEYIVFFNPDVDNSITINISLSTEEESDGSSGLSSVFWLCLIIAIVLAILSGVNFIYFFKLRKNRKELISYINERPTVLEKSGDI